jgi:hypothetical protein
MKSRGRSVQVPPLLVAKQTARSSTEMRRWLGDANPMRVATEIVEDLLGPAKGSLGIDDPGLLVQLVLPPGEGRLVGEVGAGPSEGEQPAGTRQRESSEELSAEEVAHHVDREEEASRRGDPRGTVGREAAAGDDAVDVRGDT